MQCARLQSHALHTLVCYMCNNNMMMGVAHTLQYNGIYETYGKLVLGEMVAKYPLLVTDQLLALCCHGNCREVNIKGCRNISLKGLANVLSSCVNVCTMDISECEQLLSLELVTILCQHAPRLSSLKMDGCEKLTDELLQLMIQQVKNLTEISCEGCVKLRDLRVHKPLRHMKLCNLSSVNLSGCRKVSSTFIRRLTSLTGPHLQSLNLSGTGIDCMALVSLSGYTFSSAVNVAANSTDDLSPLVFKPLHNPLSDKDSVKLKSKTSTLVDPSFTSSLSSELEMLVQTVSDLDRTADSILEDVSTYGYREEKRNMSGGSETVSTYVKQMCAYCTSDLAVNTSNTSDSSNDNMRNSSDCSNEPARNCSDCVESITLYSITESTEDYDIIDSQVVNIIETSRVFDEVVAEGDFHHDHDDDDETLDWAVLSIKDIMVDEEEVKHSPQVPLRCTCPCVNNPTCTSEMHARTRTADAELTPPATNTNQEEQQQPLQEQPEPPPQRHQQHKHEHQPPQQQQHMHHPQQQQQQQQDQYHQEEEAPTHESACSATPQQALPSIETPGTGNCTPSPSITEYGDTDTEAQYPQRTFSGCAPGTTVAHSVAHMAKRLMCEQRYIPNLTNLDISNTHFYDSEFYHADLVNQCLELFHTSNAGKLKVFSISWSSEDVSDEMVNLIATKQPKVESVSLAGCVRITNRGVIDIVDRFEQLRAIDLSGVSFVTDEPLMHLVTKHSDLTYIALAESCLSDKVLHKIAQVLPHSIRHLDLSWCENVTDEGVCHVLATCHRLTYLDLRQCEVTANTITGLTRHGSHLSVLGLSGIKGLNDTTCSEMVRHLPHLRRVDLSWNSSLTDEAITMLCRSCQALREVTISGLKRITSKPFLPIVAGLEKWRAHRDEIKERLRSGLLPSTDFVTRERDVTRMEPLDSDFYIPFRSANFLPELRKLTLGYCDKVNDNDLCEIVAVCRGTLMIEDYYGIIIQPKWSETWKPETSLRGTRNKKVM